LLRGSEGKKKRPKPRDNPKRNPRGVREGRRVSDRKGKVQEVIFPKKGGKGRQKKIRKPVAN